MLSFGMETALVPVMHLVLALFGTLSESGRLALLGTGLIGLGLVLRKVVARPHIPLASAPKVELTASKS